MKLIDRARMTTATTGTGTLTLGTAVTAYQSFAAAGAVTGDVIRYVVEDGNNWEIGYGTYNSTGPTLTRNLVSSSTGSLIVLDGAAQVFGTAISADLTTNVFISGGTVNNTSQSLTTVADQQTWTGQSVQPTWAQGLLWYDSINDGLDFLNGSSSQQNDIHLGQEVQLRVYNNTGTSIPMGSIVYINGQHSQFPTVALAQANSSTTSNAIGITNTSIENNSYGFIVSLGKFQGINTSGMTEGQIIYLSATTAGGITTTAPTYPNFQVVLGYVTYINPSQGVVEMTMPLPPPSATALTGIVSGTNGGTGVNNDSKTITIGGNFTTSGAFDTTLTATASTNVTLPISGSVISSVTNMAANPVTGTPSSSNYLRGDGTWSAIPATTLTVGTTATSGGAAGQLMYDTGSVLTESSALTFNGTALNTPSLKMQKNISAAAWTTSGIKLVGGGATLTDTTSTGTVDNSYTDVLGGNTIAATNSTTYTNYASLYVNTPTAGTNVSITNPWSIITAGKVRFPSITLTGATSGTVTLSAPSVAGTTTFTLPSSNGTNGYLLQTDGAGNTSWVTPPATGLTVGTTATSGGAAGQIMFDTGSVLQESSNLVWDNTNKKLTITGATVTTSQPVLDMTQTWNAAGTTFTGLKFNVTNTASNAASLLMDLQVGGVSRFNVKNNGLLYVAGYTGSGNAILTGYNGTYVDGQFVVFTNELGIISNMNVVAGALNKQDTSKPSWYFSARSATIYDDFNVGSAVANSTSFSQYFRVTRSGISTVSGNFIGIGSADVNGGIVADVFLTRRGAANLRFGAADAAAPVAQTLSVQSVVAGTSNTAGANLTITGSQGTGTGAGGNIIFQVAPAGTNGTAQNALSSFVTISPSSGISLSTPNVNQSITISAAYSVNSITLPSVSSGNTSIFYNSNFGHTFTGPIYGGPYNQTSAIDYYIYADLNANRNRAGSNLHLVGGIGGVGGGAFNGGNIYIDGGPSQGTGTPGLLVIGSTNATLTAFAGTTSSFPALKRSTTILQARLADDSAYAPVEASTVRTATAYTVATLPAAGTAGRRAYVTDATAPTYLGELTGGGTVVCPVFDTGTHWVSA